MCVTSFPKENIYSELWNEAHHYPLHHILDLLSITNPTQVLFFLVTHFPSFNKAAWLDVNFHVFHGLLKKNRK